MSIPPFADTLVALVESLQPPEGSGIVVEHATLDVPLEGRVDPAPSGRLVFAASLPHTRWVTGFLPPVHTAHIEVGQAPSKTARFAGRASAAWPPTLPALEAEESDDR